ncbi:hypothetical protein ACQPWW_09560 [Micromonospora sp. CA-240977]|uniref:hypothetical protein n=1 Tax=Micromonospora sp. CA-240977 TaxID=3239957 RepID=UPI003D93D630
MTRSITYVAAVIATGTALALTTAGGGEAGTTSAPSAAQRPAGPYTVTLRTGDQVSVADPAGNNLSVRPGPDRAGMRFAVVRTAGSVYVLPQDTLAQVRAGAVDRQQFEVTGLVRDRYRGAARVRADVAPTETDAEEQSYDLTIRYLGRNGSPTQDAFAAVSGWDHNVAEWPVVDTDGVSTVRLRKGRYNLGAYLGSGPDTTLMVQPVVDLTRDLTVTLDARAAGPVTPTVPEGSARLGFVDVGYSFYPAYQSWPSGMFLTGDAVSGVRVGQVGAPAAPDAMIGSVAAQWARPDGAGDFADSPYLYAVAQTFPGSLPNGFTRHYSAGDFAAVYQRFAASTPGQPARRTVSPSFTPALAGVSSLVVPTTLPGTRVEYHQTGVRWTAELLPGSHDHDGHFVAQGRLYREPTAYLAGGLYRDHWNAGPTGPAFGMRGEAAWQWASRTGDRINVALPLYGDRAGHAGSHVPTTSSRTALYRDGELVGEFPQSGGGSFTVPPETADYRIEVADTRSAGDLTTRLSAAWTFRSGHVAGEQPVRLPLSAVRFTPALNADNAAPAGRAFDLPVTVGGQPGAPAPKTTRLTVEISYDDGATWSTASLRATAAGWTATVRHPAGPGYASLRATATDAAGATLTQTIIRAYRLTAG